MDYQTRPLNEEYLIVLNEFRREMRDIVIPRIIAYQEKQAMLIRKLHEDNKIFY